MTKVDMTNIIGKTSQVDFFIAIAHTHMRQDLTLHYVPLKCI